MPTDLEGTELIVEKLDRKEFIDLLKRMLALNQEKRITPDEALNHPFITFSHLIDYAHSHRCVFDKFVVKTSSFSQTLFVPLGGDRSKILWLQLSFT